MKRPAKLLLGILTLAPPAFFALLIVKMVSMMSSALNAPSVNPNLVIEQMKSMMIPGAITTLLSLVLLVVYMVDVNKNDKLDKNGRLVWMVLFIIAGIVTMPVYFILYIHPWKQDEPTEPVARA